MKKITLILLSWTFLCVVLVGSAQAQLQNSISLSISPPHSEIIIRPGKNIVQAFNIQNLGGMDLEVTPVLVDFAADSQTGQQHVLESSSFPYAELQNLDKKLGQPFTLKSGQKDQLVMRFAIPETAQEQDFYQTLLLKTKPLGGTADDSMQSQALANVGVNLLISISNSGIDRGVLTLDRIQVPHFIDVFSPLNLDIFVKNTGTNFTKIQGEVRIISALNKKVVKVFPLLEENVLAGSVRQAHTSAPDPDDSKTAIAQDFRYEPLFLFGPYTVELALNAPNQVPQTFSGRVWALPFSPLLVIVTFLVAKFLLKKLRKPQIGL